MARRRRNYRREYARYHGRPEQRRRRSMRNKARRKMGLKRGDSREVHPKRALSKGGGNRRSNLKVMSRRANRRKGTRR